LYAAAQAVWDAVSHAAARLTPDVQELHTVAAAVMDVNGNVYTGVNVHHFTGGPCAELVALGAAAAAGAGPITEIAAIGIHPDRKGVPMAPCGRCRQILLDQQPDCNVIMPSERGLVAMPIRRLLPYSYRHPDARPARILRFNPEHWAPVMAGAKMATTRFDDPAVVGPVTLLFEFEERYRPLPGVIDSIEPVALSDISDAQAGLEGCTADELRRSLRTVYYPGIADNARVDFIRFHTMPVDSGSPGAPLGAA